MVQHDCIEIASMANSMLFPDFSNACHRIDVYWHCNETSPHGNNICRVCRLYLEHYSLDGNSRLLAPIPTPLRQCDIWRAIALHNATAKCSPCALLLTSEKLHCPILHGRQHPPKFAILCGVQANETLKWPRGSTQAIQRQMFQPIR